MTKVGDDLGGAAARRAALLEAIQEEEVRLARLAAEHSDSRARLATLQSELAAVASEPEVRVRPAIVAEAAVPRTATEKVSLFRSLFQGRPDVFPTSPGVAGFRPCRFDPEEWHALRHLGIHTNSRYQEDGPANGGRVQSEQQPTASPATSCATRRCFLAGMAVAGLSLIRVPRVFAAMGATRSLAFHHVNTGEHLTVEYFAGGKYLPGALHDVNHILRDWRTNQMHPIDPDLLDLLSDLHQASGSRIPFEVICGYRSPATNTMLASRSHNVSPKSLHLQGKAVDIRLGDVSLDRLRTTALGLRRGGVGYYPESNFVHVDTGRVRAW